MAQLVARQLADPGIRVQTPSQEDLFCLKKNNYLGVANLLK